MKKYFLTFLAVVALLLTSCNKNKEAISVSREVTFEVNPYTVVNDFAKYEIIPGDLSTVFWYDLGDRLRIQLFIYDNRGDLVKSEVKYVNDYTSTMSAKFELLDGSYTIVAVTDEVGLVGNNVTDEYWLFSGTNRLSDLQIVGNDEEWLDHRGRKLGISSKTITVGAGCDTFDIDVKAAGAMIRIMINNIHHFYDVDYYSIWMTRMNANFSFSSNGFYNVASTQSDYLRGLSVIHPDNFNSNITTVYDYRFIAPFGNTGFRWEVMLDDGTYGIFLEEKYVNIQAGKSYGCVLDLKSNNNSSFIFEDLDNSKGLLPPVDSEAVHVAAKDKSACRIERSKPEVIGNLGR